MIKTVEDQEDFEEKKNQWILISQFDERCGVLTYWPDSWNKFTTTLSPCCSHNCCATRIDVIRITSIRTMWIYPWCIKWCYNVYCVCALNTVLTTKNQFSQCCVDLEHITKCHCFIDGKRILCLTFFFIKKLLIFTILSNVPNEVSPLLCFLWVLHWVIWILLFQFGFLFNQNWFLLQFLVYHQNAYSLNSMSGLMYLSRVLDSMPKFRHLQDCYLFICWISFI